MPLKDVFVEITRETRPPTRRGFGLPLIIGETNGGHVYDTYRNLEQVEADFADTTEEYKAAAQVFAQSPAPERVAIACVDDATVPDADTYQALLEELDKEDWYACLLINDDAVITKRVSDYINGVLAGKDEANKLLFVRSSAAVPADMDQDRTVFFYHSVSGELEKYPEAAWLGRCLPSDPGSITWKFKDLRSVLPLANPVAFAPMDISRADMEDLHDHTTDGGSQNTYVSKMGFPQTSEGKVGSGEFIDVMRSSDFVLIRIKENIQRLLTESPKVPYTNQGIALVVAEVEEVMQAATAQGIVAIDDDGNGLWSVTAPRREETSESDRADRILRDVEFEFYLAGAVHEVHVRGVIRI